jgi:hypothetical protein
VRPCFHGDPHPRQVGKPLLDAGWVGSEAAPVDNLAVLVERAVMAPDISKVDPDRHFNPFAILILQVSWRNLRWRSLEEN